MSYETANMRAPRLLVAEDHRVNRALIQAVLEALGYEVTLVENGREAVDAVRAGGFDGVLLDIEMPVMDGLQAADAIRALEIGGTTRLPLLALSAHEASEVRREPGYRQFDGFVGKPLNARELAEVLGRILAKAHSA